MFILNTSKSEYMEPLVILIDLDGTMQGNVLPQIKEKEIVDFINKLKSTSQRVNYKDMYLFSDMRKGLIRPYLQEALFEIKKAHSNVEFFVYTASSDNWANFLLPKINRFLFDNKKIINKPFFTRKHCLINGKKHIEPLKPLIFNALKHKYPKSNLNNIFLIDNNYVLTKPEFNRLIYCPTYDMTILNCPLRNFNKGIIENYYKELAFYMYRSRVRSVRDFLRLYYDKSVKEYIYLDNYNSKYKNDNYWLNVKNVFLSYNKLVSQKDVNSLIKELKHLKVN